MLCSVYTTIAGEYDGPGFCTPIGINILYYYIIASQQAIDSTILLLFFGLRLLL